MSIVSVCDDRCCKETSTLYVKTSLTLRNVRDVCSAYEAIRQVEPTVTIQQACLTDNLWAEFLIDKNIEGYDLLHTRECCHRCPLPDVMAYTIL